MCQHAAQAGVCYTKPAAVCGECGVSDLALDVLPCIGGSHCPLLLLQQPCQCALLVHLIDVWEGLHPGKHQVRLQQHLCRCML